MLTKLHASISFAHLQISIQRGQIFVFTAYFILNWDLTHCSLKEFETHIQIFVEANVARGCMDTGNILVSMNLHFFP